MRKLLVTATAAAALFAAGLLASPPAEAMPLAQPNGLTAAIPDNNLTQDVAYFCRRVWRCGYWGCGWRRMCTWGPGYGYGGYPGYYSYGYARPWGWRHRHWW